MSEQINVEARVDELSKPENKAELESVLNSQFNQATNSADENTAAGQEPENNIPNVDPENTVEPANAEPQPAAPSKDDKNTGEGANKGDRYKDLLADRNQAKETAAEALTENQVLAKQVSDLTDLIQKLVSEKNQNGDVNAPGAEAPADGNNNKDLASIINEILDKRESEKSSALNAEKSIIDSIQKLEGNSETPHAKEYQSDIKQLMEKHPSISAYMAYMALVGSGRIPSGKISSNANKTGTGNRTKSGLTTSKNVNDMTQAEMEAHLRQEEASGALKGQI